MSSHSSGGPPAGRLHVQRLRGPAGHPERVLIDHVVDLAEIPALQARQRMGGGGGEPVDPEGAADYRRRECARVAEAVTVRLDGA